MDPSGYEACGVSLGRKPPLQVHVGR